MDNQDKSKDKQKTKNPKQVERGKKLMEYNRHIKELIEKER